MKVMELAGELFGALLDWVSQWGILMFLILICSVGIGILVWLFGAFLSNIFVS